MWLRGCSYFYLKVFVEVIIEKGLKAPLFDRFVFSQISQREFSDFRDEGPPRDSVACHYVACVLSRTSAFMRTLLWPLKIPIVDALKLPAAATWLVLYENSSRDERVRNLKSAGDQRRRD